MTDLLAYLELLQSTYPLIVLSIAAVFGLLIGSFLNVVVHRLPQIVDHDLKMQACEILEKEPPAPLGMTLSKPRSRCPTCKHLIRAWENIPVLSYLALRGRCTNCKSPISVRYPIVEATCGLMTACVIAGHGLGPTGLALAGLAWVLLTLALIDFDTQYLLDEITLPTIWAGMLVNYFGLVTTLGSAVIGAVAGYLTFWSIFWVFKLLTGKDALGYGDFKLLALLGAWLGWEAIPLIIMLSSLVGAVAGAIMIARGRDASRPISFGPYLATAGFVAIMWGDSIMTAYWSFMAPSY